jgi:Fe-S-cluster-containing hydrogenase component 2
LLWSLEGGDVQKSLYINADKCTGCLQCEMACSYENYGVFNPAKSRIKIFDFHHSGKKVPYTCTQCDEAWCLHACPVEAIKVDAATGAKIVLEDVCVGCKVCTIACPFGTINYVQDSGKVRSATSAAVSPPAPRPALPARSPISTPIGPGSSACSNGRTRLAINHTRKEDDHGLDSKDPARRSRQGDLHVGTPQHAMGT